MTKRVCLLSVVLFFISCSQKNEKITELSQLNDTRICVLTGSAGDLAARKAFPDAEFLTMITASDAAYNIKIGKAAAFVHNKSVLLNIVKKDSGLTIIDSPVSSVEIAAAFSKENPQLLSEINNALAELITDGTLKKMKEKWIDSEYQTVPELPNIENDFQNGTLTMGTCALAEPLTFLYNNKITGFDIELSLRIGKLLGKKIEIVDMNFESLIPALKSGKIDFAFSNFNVTDERKKFVAFSTPYLVQDISALVKK